jgi:DNA polymerase II small subunit/DNA polymerase delta subunit B
MKMKRKKLKITIECEGQPTQTIEANGIAAALLTDGEDSDHHGLKVLICGHMNMDDLLHLHDGVGKELIEGIESQIMSNLSAKDLLKALLGGMKDESER